MSENGDDFVSDSQSVFFYSKHPNIVLGSYNHSALEAKSTRWRRFGKRLV